LSSMKLMAINCGSSSVKYRLFEVAENRVFLPIAKGTAGRIGQGGSYIQHSLARGKEIKIEKSIPDVESALREIF